MAKLLFGSAPTFKGIQKVIAKFYGGEAKKLEPENPKLQGSWTVHKSDGARIPNVRVQVVNGRYQFFRE